MRKVASLGFVMILCFGIFTIFAGDAPGQTRDAEKINVNQAAQADFYTLPGMTETLAKAIIEYRTKAGRFDTPADLLKVPGMTKDYLDRISSRIVILPEEDEVKLPKY